MGAKNIVNWSAPVALIEEEGITDLTETETDAALSPLQTAAYTHRIALGPRAGQKA